jgi:4-amino-4-deoxy-L-arabinose transferase-like glycosyltransferase
MALIRERNPLDSLGPAAHVGPARPAWPVLVPLLAGVLILGVAWAMLTPPLQAPDETTHFAYAQSLAERGAFPDSPGRETFSTEQRLLQDAAGTQRTALIPSGRPTWSAAAEARWRAAAAGLPGAARSDGGGPNPASLNPPLYYAYGALPYWAGSGATIVDRLRLMRLASVLFALGTVVGTWLLAGEVFGRDRIRQLAAAGTVGLLPMVTFVSASFNPDALLWGASSLALWLAVRIVRRGLTAASGGGLLAVAAVGVATKLVFLALAPALALGLGVGLWRRTGRDGPSGRVVAALAAAGLAGLAVVGLATGVLSGRVDPRIFASYLWQFYLPRLPFQRDFPALGGLPAYEVWVKTGWGAFGWFETRLPEPVYVALAALTLVVAVGAAVALWRGRRRLDAAVPTLLAVAALSLLFILHLVEAYSITVGQGAITQGRYLLPLAPLGGLGVAATLTLLHPVRRSLAVGGVLGLLVALQLLSLAVVADRFYA